MRFWEIDALRGVAIFLVVAFHFVFDLDYFTSLSCNADAWYWELLGLVSAILFIGIAGLSATVSYWQTIDQGWYLCGKKIFKRFLILLFWALVINLVTFLLMPSNAIYFGILHFLALASLLGIPFLRLGFMNFVMAFLFYVAFYFLEGISISHFRFLWLGLVPNGFCSMDYFPLIPWFACYLFGMGCGNLLYPKGRRRFSLAVSTPNSLKSFVFLGNHTLTIYLIHQPILIGLLSLDRLIA